MMSTSSRLGLALDERDVTQMTQLDRFPSPTLQHVVPSVEGNIVPWS
jgi:hypothetical protein